MDEALGEGGFVPEAPVVKRGLKRMDFLFFAFILFLFARFLLTGIFLNIYTVLVFGAPFVYFFFKKEYHIFFFDLKDTGQSIAFNIVASIIVIIILLIIGWATKNLGWVVLLSVDAVLLIKLFIISFFHEMLFRYFIQQRLTVILENPNMSIIITSLISALIIMPPFLKGVVYLVMGLALGWVYNKTNDIYGVTLANFIISAFSLVMV